MVEYARRLVKRANVEDKVRESAGTPKRCTRWKQCRADPVLAIGTKHCHLINVRARGFESDLGGRPRLYLCVEITNHAEIVRVVRAG